MIFNCREIVTPEKVWSNSSILIEDGVIAEIRDEFTEGAEFLDGWLVPGFVDTHSHGAAGFDFANEDRDGVLGAIRYHREHGSTSLFASTVTEEMDEVYAQVARLKELVEAGELDGIHLEGPFLAEAKKGAHNVNLLRDPEPELVARLIYRGGKALKMITLAPERAHGLEAVRTFAKHGVAPAFGHSDGDAEVTKLAIDAGASVATHLFNAMSPIHHRVPGPVPVLLDDERVVVELICDGTHLAPEIVRMAIDAAGVERVALVTDAMSATGQADGDYSLGTLQVQVRDGVARLATEDGSEGAIAGSTLTMDKAVEFVVNRVGCTIQEASIMASTTPAKLHHLDNVGVIEPGRFADFCLFNDHAETVAVMRRGEWVRRDD